MFDIGFAELLIVGVVALIVLGPERLPMALKTAGMWLGRIKRAVSGVQKEISEELRIEEMRRAAKEQQQKLEREASSMTRPFSDSLRDEILAPQTSSPTGSAVEEPASGSVASVTGGSDASVVSDSAPATSAPKNDSP